MTKPRGLRRGRRALGTVLVAGSIVAILSACTPSGVETPSEPGTGLVSPAATPIGPPSPSSAPLARNLRPTGATVRAPVVRVVDGDTIVVQLDGRNVKVRYIGMDTPETKKPGSPIEWMGPEASAANAALVASRDVVLERDVSETDRYGRLLRDVWLHDGDRWTLVNLELVELGFAQVATYPPDVKYVGLLLAAQRAARAAGAGLWGPRPSSTP